MNFKNLIDKYDWLSVQYILLKIYPETNEDIEKYREIYNELKVTIPKGNLITMRIERVWENGCETNYAHVFGYDKSLPDTELTKSIAIEFSQWNEWLNFKIEKDVLKEWTDLEIISHSLIEMTLDGFSQKEIQSYRNELINQVHNLKKSYLNNSAK